MVLAVPAVVLDVAALVELVAVDELDVASDVVLVGADVDVVETTDDGGVTTELAGGSFWKISNRMTVSASTPTTTATAVPISREERTGAPCASATLRAAAVAHAVVPVVVRTASLIV